jgi:hypothetical protein
VASHELDDKQVIAQTNRINADVIRSAAETRRTRAETLAVYCKAAMFVAIGLAALGLAY